jgi:hypothetical protein
VSIALLGFLELSALVAGAALLGLVDDVWGGSGAKGFRGHLSEARRGRVSTGLLKMVGIGALALWATWHALYGRPGGPTIASGGWEFVARWIIAAALIALAANLLNLLDVRPGRALKAYALLALPPAVALAWPGGSSPGDPMQVLRAVVGVIAALGPLLAVWYLDLGERAMLGDMGANALGALAGALLVEALPLPWLAACAVVLLALNLASERVSFSAVIERNGVLRRLDMLGRAPADERGG